MDKLWKMIMHLNAKAFCLLAMLLFFGTAAWCGFKYMTPTEPFRDGGNAKLPELPPAWELGALTFVSNQLAAETLAIPVDPFRPTIEAIFTNETERAAFLKALRAAQVAAAGLGSGTADGKKEDHFAHLRQKRAAAPGELVGADGRPMVIPTLSFLGFFQRPDGKQAAMFHDSVENTTVFYDAGKQSVHGVEILGANVNEAEIRFPDGTTRKLEIGGKVELAAEPAKIPPPKPKPTVKPGAGPVKPGAAAAAAKPAAKPNVKPGAAAAPQKAGQEKPAQQKVAAKQQQKRQGARQKAQEQ